ncbi:SMP-30/gluconolactonase/LRE family protein [Paenibacillus dakarensis]|uniref:SMP-30/gluconolactonase/LRE family protein n=1 Tax=Paenibacillus dakarensis TaxID=1527293 RepID=UPI0006D57D7E|nr:SMP-30/gluconolactonase/LRE family protein [Paenibacillus dakarensis]
MMESSKLECVLRKKAVLGEGPFWESGKERLIWVDIEGKSLHFYNPAASEDKVYPMEKLIGTAVPAADGSYLLALQDGIYRFREEDGTMKHIASPERHIPGNRFNDGKCDPTGRFWLGTLNMEGKSGMASLYRMDADLKITRVETGIGLSNGMGWSPAGDQMYFIDTTAGTVYAYDYRLDTGEISGRRVLLRFSGESGMPDGMTVDADGRLWIAHWGGSRVTCWDPVSFKEQERIELPARLVTSCAFGGDNLEDLYITTADDQESGQEDPYGGSLFRIKTGAKGMPAASFGSQI